MAVAFDINTYDILQRAISTAEALNQLGTDPVEAAYEAAETVLDEREDTVAQRAYIVEWAVGAGPEVDVDVVAEIIDRPVDEETVSAHLDGLLMGVLTSAVHTEAFDTDPGKTFANRREPLDEYDAKPEQIMSLFISEAEAFHEDEGSHGDYASRAEEAAAAAVDKHRDKLEQLSFTALCIVVDHLHEEYGVDAEVDFQVDETLNETGIRFFEASLGAFLSEVTDTGYD